MAGRGFADLADLNIQARAFCETVNASPKRHLHASPRELSAAEHARLRPLPLVVPEVYALHHRLVDVEGYVNVHGHRYPVPYLLIGRQLEVRETADRIDVYHGPRLVVPAGQRERLERVCRYALRPPVSQERLHVTDEGQVRLQLRQPWRDGTTTRRRSPPATFRV